MTLLICECVERPVIQVVVITSHRTQRIDEGDDLVLQVLVVHFFSPQALLLPKGPPIR